jgi:hypothetical protein
MNLVGVDEGSIFHDENCRSLSINKNLKLSNNEIYYIGLSAALIR